MDALIKTGEIVYAPLIYEDFLPVSAAGIFQSNLGSQAAPRSLDASSRADFVAALGSEPADPFDLYDALEAQSRSALELGVHVG